MNTRRWIVAAAVVVVAGVTPAVVRFVGQANDDDPPEQAATVQDPPEHVHDFGPAPAERGPLVHAFPFANTAAVAVDLHVIKTSCGCLAVDHPPRVGPGETAMIRGGFESSRG